MGRIGSSREASFEVERARFVLLDSPRGWLLLARGVPFVKISGEVAPRNGSHCYHDDHDKKKSKSYFARP
jgi:hypothetical protein